MNEIRKTGKPSVFGKSENHRFSEIGKLKISSVFRNWKKTEKNSDFGFRKTGKFRFSKFDGKPAFKKGFPFPFSKASVFQNGFPRKMEVHGMTVKELADRLRTYPVNQVYEPWRTETDLNKCTEREKEEMVRLDVTPEDLMALALNRGEVHHILFGYRFAEKRQS